MDIAVVESAAHRAAAGKIEDHQRPSLEGKPHGLAKPDTQARWHACPDLALLDGNGNDLCGTEVLRSEHAAPHSCRIGKGHVLGPHAEHERLRGRLFVSFGNSDGGVANPDRAVAALQSALEVDE